MKRENNMQPIDNIYSLSGGSLTPQSILTPQLDIPAASLILIDPESLTSAKFNLTSYQELYVANQVIEHIRTHVVRSDLSLDDLTLGVPEFDLLLRDFGPENLVLSFPNDDETSVMLPLNLLINRPSFLSMFLEDSKYIINEAFKRSIINHNIILRFNTSINHFFYLKVSKLMGQIRAEYNADTERTIFSFRTNLKYPDTFDFSQVTMISNIDSTRFSPFSLSDVHLLQQPTELPEVGIYHLLFDGILNQTQPNQ